MTQDGISITADAASPLPPASGVRLPAQKADETPRGASEQVKKTEQSGVVDRVTIMNKTLELKQEARKEEAEREEGSREQPSRTMNNILFAYNFRGDLRIRFMDSASKLVYQMPPVLVARLSDIMMRPDSSVNTKA
ncbi:MAG: hypothetical protein HYV06_00605 [Deltaproteobacteria bacterium]|nr:hypothetical protein [Deltaproteobacteria bacterium]